MKYLVAVSGGVDSVVLLDMLAHKYPASDLVVAHVDHGIRPDSSDDARFVAGLAYRYGLKFVTTRLELGAEASEDRARQSRYAFLFDEAKKYGACIVTAHHADDLVGTVAINFYRGTGWRGLAVLARQGIERPLLALRKKDIYEYALRHQLEWVEDSTNRSAKILRNRLRPMVHALELSTIKQITDLRDKQVMLSGQVDTEVRHLNRQFSQHRYPYTVLNPVIAAELLRVHIEDETGIRPTRPDADRLLLAIKTARPGKVFEGEGGVRIRFSARQFVVEHHLK